MKHTHPRIVFMGTPEFAVPSLEALVEAGFPVVGVVTAPDKPAGRGQQLQASAVKQAALRLGIPVLQPEKLRSPEFLEQLKSLQADLQIVVAFRMLPEVIWSAPPMGTFNLHASLLPQYRGAAPINWAIIQGERFTGITTFFLRQDIDTGNILLQEKVEIGTDETV
ncbi:MAG TPA: methionyl-tRNA formyltransferase, partial [Bacteroidia bacterium]|nr:methionyl-tRNA formyltransferase [Bacteroidia bacterium]